MEGVLWLPIHFLPQYSLNQSISTHEYRVTDYFLQTVPGMGDVKMDINKVSSSSFHFQLHKKTRLSVCFTFLWPSVYKHQLQTNWSNCRHLKDRKAIMSGVYLTLFPLRYDNGKWQWAATPVFPLTTKGTSLPCGGRTLSSIYCCHKAILLLVHPITDNWNMIQ